MWRKRNCVFREVNDEAEYEISGSTADDAEGAVMASENVNTPENRQFLKHRKI